MSARELEALRAEGWPQRAIEDYERFGRRRVALLYHLIDVDGAARVRVRTRKGERDLQATVLSAMGGYARVVLYGEPKRVPGTKNRPISRELPAERVRPAIFRQPLASQ